MMRSVLLLVPAFVSLCGCTVDDEHRFPSLARRPVESRPDAPVPPAEAAVLPVDPALDEQLHAIVRDAEAGQAGFRKAAEGAQAALARGRAAAEGSDAWADAQTALSALIAARGPVQDAAATLDRLRQQEAGQPPAGLAAIDAAARTVDAITAEQAETIARLSGGAG